MTVEVEVLILRLEYMYKSLKVLKSVHLSTEKNTF